MFPGLAVARELQRRGHKVSLWLSGREAEQASVSGWDGPTVFVKARGFDSRLSVGAIAVVGRLVSAYVESRRQMRRDRPSVLLAMGSYASVGPAFAARSLHVPLVLHEANAVPGRAVALLAPRARAVAVGFKEAGARLRCRRVIHTGFPIRDDLLGQRFDDGVLSPGVLTVLVMGGSQGAHRVNELATEAICRLRAQGVPLQVVHLAGRQDEGFVREAYRRAGVRGPVFGFLREMGAAYAAADLAISRAGAASCAELAATGVPALFIPLPTARRDHQEHNARVFERAGAADVLLQKGLTAAGLADYIEACRRDEGKRARMRAAMGDLAIMDATSRIASMVEDYA